MSLNPWICGLALSAACLAAGCNRAGVEIVEAPRGGSQPVSTEETRLPAEDEAALDEPVEPIDDPGSLPEKWQSHATGLPFVMGYETGLAKAQSEKKPIMFFVTTTWCGWCKKLAQENFRNPQVRELLKENFVLVIVDGDTERDAAASLGARGFPHIVFQTAAGRRLETVSGYKPASTFLPIVKDVVKATRPNA